MNELFIEAFKWIFRDHPTLLAVLVLLFRQNSIKRIINRQLPRQFRDNLESDVAEIKQGIDDLKVHMGVVVSNTQLNGLKTIPILSYKRFFLLLQTISNRKRRMIFMEKLKSRKFWLTILAALIPIINTEFNINLDLGSIIAIMTAIMSGVGFLAHVDAKKVLANIVHPSKPILTVANAELAYTTFKEAVPYIKVVHDGVNKLLEDVKRDDGSQSFKDALQAYNAIMAIIEANKHPEPVVIVAEGQEVA
jgi:hypothetical protein